MREVLINPYVEDGVLKVQVNGIDRENGTCETLEPDGTWRKSLLYVPDPNGAFAIGEGWSQKIANDLAGGPA